MGLSEGEGRVQSVLDNMPTVLSRRGEGESGLAYRDGEAIALWALENDGYGSRPLAAVSRHVSSVSVETTRIEYQGLAVLCEVFYDFEEPSVGLSCHLFAVGSRAGEVGPGPYDYQLGTGP